MALPGQFHRVTIVPLSNCERIQGEFTYGVPISGRP